MTVVADEHEALGATFREMGGRRVVAGYGKPARTHRAVRNGVGVVEMGYGVLAVTGGDRVDYVDNAVSNRVPRDDGTGTYALLLDPQGAIRTDMYVLNAGERLLVLTPPGRAEPLAEEWRERTFIEDVAFELLSDDLAVFGVHGPTATEKVASVLTGAASPDGRLGFVRGSMGDVGVTVLRTDAPTGEEGYEVVCGAADAPEVLDTLLTRGLNAVPFGYDVRDGLTLEAGTPLFETELDGELPNVLGIRNGLDFEKGCFVGQEVVARVENRGRPSRRLVGLAPESVPAGGATVVAGDAAVGEVTRAARSPSLEAPVALALVDYDASPDAVRVDGEPVAASRVDLPFVEGSERSARLPAYPGEDG